MKLIGIDNREYSIQPKDYIVYEDDKRKKSELHLEARKILKEEFKAQYILEEVPLPGCGVKLILDFLIPSSNLAIEVQGIQHYKFNPHFFVDKMAFALQKKRDNLKKQVCELNNLLMIELRYDEKDKWLEQIRNRHDTT